MKTMILLLTVNVHSDVNNAFNNIVNYIGLRNIKTDEIENMPFIKGFRILDVVDYELSLKVCEICEEHQVLPIFIDIENVNDISKIEMLRFKL